MKPILSITEKEFTAIPSTISRGERVTVDDIIMLTGVLINYDADWSELNGHVASFSIDFNASYVEVLFEAMSYLHQYYEFSQRHFELLDCAAKNIELLYSKKIQELMSNPETIAKTRVELAFCLEKISLIFQTAADKTEDKQQHS